MLSGIKVGKKKIKSLPVVVVAATLENPSTSTGDDGNDDDDDVSTKPHVQPPPPPRLIPQQQQQFQRKQPIPPSTTTIIDRNNINDNSAVADQLRRQLLQFTPPRGPAAERLDEPTIHNPTPQQQLQHHTAVFNSMGSKRDKSDMSNDDVLDLLKQEKAMTSNDDERLLYKTQLGNKKKRGHCNDSNDDDDDDIFQTHLYTDNNPSTAKQYTNERDNDKRNGMRSDDVNDDPNHHRNTLQHQQQANHHRVIHQNNNHNNETNSTRCYWWIQSSNFASHRYVALPKNNNSNNNNNNSMEGGGSVILCFAAPSESIVFGEHFFIVPIDYTPSFSTISDPMMWEEIRTVQTILRSMAQSQNQGVLFFEAYFDTKKNRSTHGEIRQARIEAVFVPLDTFYDAPLFFRSALTEQAEDNGTKPNIIVTNTISKPLYRAIPKQFPYFYVEYDDTINDRTTTTTTKKNNGYLLLIESNQFPNTFGVDTIASMMDMEPMRFRGRGGRGRRLDPEGGSDIAEERRVITQFRHRHEKILNGV